MLFAVKAFMTAVLLIALMQIQIGGSTIETKAENWVRTSEATTQLRHVAAGAIKVTGDLWKKTMVIVGMKSEPSPARNKGWNVEFRRQMVKDEGESAD